MPLATAARATTTRNLPRARRQASSNSSRGKTAKTIPPSSLILPGQSVGELKLGDSKDQFLHIFQWKPGTDEDYNYPASANCPGEEELHWLDAGNPPFANAAAVHVGVFAYLRDGHIFQISVATPRFQTANGITEDSSPENVKRLHPNLQAYWRVNQHDIATGDRDFVYWIDQRSGIAFEFYYARNVRRRLVYRVYVFNPATSFVPEGCVQPPQAWKKVTPYSLDPPTESP